MVHSSFNCGLLRKLQVLDEFTKICAECKPKEQGEMKDFP